MKLNCENRWHAAKRKLAGIGTGALAFALAGTLAVSALGFANGAESGTATQQAATTAEKTLSATSASSAESGVLTTTIDESLYDLEYTSRDQDASYDLSKAVAVKLEGASASADDEGVSIEGSTITLSAEGVYVLSGSYEGQVVVDAPEDAKVQVVLDNARIANATGSALYVKQADKCFVTLADGSSNSLEDGSSYNQGSSEDEPDAALYSTCDLTLQGTGALKVTGNCDDAVKTKDDLVVTGGTYDVTSVSDGLVGKDSVKILDANLEISAGDDGIKSSKDDDESKGFVSLDGGTIAISAADKGINAVSYLRIEDGVSLSIAAGDDALHCDGCGRMDGGEVTIEAGDDGFHVEYALELNGGSLDIVQSNEGLEGQTITMNDGVASVVSSDDGVNAASPENTATAASPVEQAAPTAGSAQGPNSASGGSAAPSALNGSNAMQGPQGGNGFRGMADSDSNCIITINGGTLVVQAEGDGLDSNGYLRLNGGEVYVSGPTATGNGSLDCALGAEVNGGTLIAAGAAQMAESFSAGTQGFALVQASGSTGDKVSVADESGNILASFTAGKQFQCVLVTAPGMQDGQSYRLSVNGSETSFQATTSGMGGNMGQPGMGGQMPGMGQGGGIGGVEGNSFGPGAGNGKRRPDNGSSGANGQGGRSDGFSQAPGARSAESSQGAPTGPTTVA